MVWTTNPDIPKFPDLGEEHIPFDWSALPEVNIAGTTIPPQFHPERFKEEERITLGNTGDKRYNHARHFLAERKSLYCVALSRCGNHAAAASAACTTGDNARWHRKRFKEFENACLEAMELFCASLQMEAVKRARDGWDEPVFYQGEIVGTRNIKSDRLMELQLKAFLPELFRENIDINATVSSGVLVVPQAAGVEDWSAQFEKLRDQQKQQALEGGTS